MHPLLDPDVVLGGLYVPTDGLAKAVRAVEAQTRRAAARGARLLPRHEVLDITVDRRPGHRRRHRPGRDPGRHRGLLRRHLGPEDRGHGRHDPAADPAGAPARLDRPRCRRSRARPRRRCCRSCGTRTRTSTTASGSTRLGIGYYGHRPMPIRAEDIARLDDAEVMPSVLPFTQDDFDEAWRRDPAAAARRPRDAKIEEGINGLFSFTTDNMPLIGRVARTCAGFWVAEAVWVTHSAGVGRAIAEWLVDGHCSRFDLHECDVNRFEPHQLAPEYVLDPRLPELRRGLRHPPPAAADGGTCARCAPARSTPRQRELGAVLPGGDRLGAPAVVRGQRRPRRRPRHPDPERLGRAVLVADRRAPRRRSTRERGRDVRHDGAQAARGRPARAPPRSCSGLATGNVDKSVGSVTYCLLLDDDGGIRSDITVARLGARPVPGRRQRQPRPRLAAPPPARRRHRAGPRHHRRHLLHRPVGPARPRPGPAADRHRLLATTALKYFRGHARPTSAPCRSPRCGCPTSASSAGSSTPPPTTGRKLWDTLWEAGQAHGVIAAGRGAFNSLRLEKGYRSFGADMTYEHDPYEAGLGFAVKLDKGDFIGREALRRPQGHQHPAADLPHPATTRRRSSWARSRCTPATAASATSPAPPTATRSARASPTPGCPAELADAGHRGADRLLRPAGRRPSSTAEPLFDPAMTRLRG